MCLLKNLKLHMACIIFLLDNPELEDEQSMMALPKEY